MNIPFDSTSLTAQSVFADATDSPGIRDFEFSLCLRGRGHTEDEAWQDATDAFHFDQYQADLPAEAERMKTATRQVIQLLRCYRGTPPQAAATLQRCGNMSSRWTSSEVALLKKKGGETPAKDFLWSQEIPPLFKN